MRYVIAGYVFVLGTLFLYAVQLVWRRRRLTRTVARVSGSEPGTPPTPGVSPVTPVGSHPAPEAAP